MSRTERKRDKYSWQYVDINNPEDHVYLEDKMYKVSELSSRQKRKVKAMMKTDAKAVSNAPADFRKSIEKSKRAKDKAEINKINSQANYKGYNFNPRKNDANWNWW